MGKKYNLDTPEPLWNSWKRTVPRSYPKLNDRVIELLVADSMCHEEHGKGVIEVLDDNNLLDTDDVETRIDDAPDS